MVKKKQLPKTIDTCKIHIIKLKKEKALLGNKEEKDKLRKIDIESNIEELNNQIKSIKEKETLEIQKKKELDKQQAKEDKDKLKSLEKQQKEEEKLRIQQEKEEAKLKAKGEQEEEYNWKDTEFIQGLKLDEKEYRLISLMIQNTYVEKYIRKAIEINKTNARFLDELKQKFNKGYIWAQRQVDQDKLIQEELMKGKVKKQSLGLGVHKELFYYGVKVNGKNAVVTSDKTLYMQWDEYNNAIKTDFELDCVDEFLEEVTLNPWDTSGDYSVNDYLFKTDLVIPKVNDLFTEIKNIFKEYVWFQDEAIYNLLACEIISTYVYVLFEAKGRILITADYGSGKTRLAEVGSLMAFNSIMGASMTPAVLDRVIESTKGTLFLDNFDNLEEEKQKNTEQIIQVGYKQGAKSFKADGDKHKTNARDLYSPMFITCILGLNEVSTSRCNKIPMLQTNDKKYSKKKLSAIKKQCETISNKLRVWSLTNWKNVSKTYNELELNDLGNRDFEKAVSVLTIAKLIDDNVLDSIKTFLIKSTEQTKIKEIEDNWEYYTIEIIFNVFRDKEIEELRIRVKDITDIALGDSNYKIDLDNKLKYSHYVGKVLGTYPQLFEKTSTNGWVTYKFTESDIKKLAELKGYYIILLQKLTIVAKTDIKEYLEMNSEMNINLFVKKYPEECLNKAIEVLKEQGDIFEPRKDYFRRVEA